MFDVLSFAQDGINLFWFGGLSQDHIVTKGMLQSL